MAEDWEIRSHDTSFRTHVVGTLPLIQLVPWQDSRNTSPCFLSTTSKYLEVYADPLSNYAQTKDSRDCQKDLSVRRNQKLLLW